ncbi:ABC transporter permease [Halomicrobium sp. LC1Hm]|uniref:ABC transporter permease n=1 Tax=Halomicrobium sp. LC1Hm TaxID=2610902 RepID=UPI00129850CE|nr:ABC transporter permease [Halomicrobium sp. LC1Hm]QGA83667.1 ABC-type dipeptide/oligopeptide/nickel transport system, permease component [Halomicrobium sp. LC1Hm]
MKFLRVVAWRVALGGVAAWAVLTAVFGLFTLTEDWVLQRQVGALKWAGEEEDAIAAVRDQYLGTRGLDRPLAVQYLDWLGNMVTLDWGRSFVTGDPVFGTVLAAAGRTAMYVLPALALAVAVGVAFGLFLALRPESRLGSVGLGTIYLAFAVPNFWLGGLLVSLARAGVISRPPLVFEHLLPIVLTATTLLGGVVSYARAHAAEHASADFVRLLRAKGAGSRRVATHVLRNAAVPIFSLVFTEALALLVLAVFVVEVLFGIDGFGSLLFRSVDQRDLPVLLGGTLVIIAVGVVGNVVQDLSYGVLDPRIDDSGR